MNTGDIRLYFRMKIKATAFAVCQRTNFMIHDFDKNGYNCSWCVQCTSACDPNRLIENFVMSAFQCYYLYELRITNSILWNSFLFTYMVQNIHQIWDSNIHSENVLFYWIWSSVTHDSASWKWWSSIKSNPWIKLLCILAFWLFVVFNSWCIMKIFYVPDLEPHFAMFLMMTFFWNLYLTLITDSIIKQ